MSCTVKGFEKYGLRKNRTVYGNSCDSCNKSVMCQTSYLQKTTNYFFVQELSDLICDYLFDDKNQIKQLQCCVNCNYLFCEFCQKTNEHSCNICKSYMCKYCTNNSTHICKFCS